MSAVGILGAGRRLVSAAVVGAVVSACGPGVGAGPSTEVEFILEQRGGLCATDDGGALCRFTVVVRDDGAWSSTSPVGGPDAAGGSVAAGSASELAAILESEWEMLTAVPFTATCPMAYDGTETVYTIRRLPVGAGAELADASVRELPSCTYDLDRAEARAVIERLEERWRGLGLPQ